ncbi:hypothetical protein [Kangiella marina]|uniref:Uncharacterized protein n=1 Tax=Kangiella marina TaxID=1079178 RepID=A0ABP8IGH3_9GAMM
MQSLFEANPTILAALIGALITLTGVIIAGVIQYKTHSNKLKHEAKSADKQQSLNMKKDVYLKAIEELYATQSQLTALGDINLAQENPSHRLNDFFRSIYRVYMVASDETMFATQDFLLKYMKSYFDLLLESSTVQNSLTHKNISEQTYKRYENEVNRLLETIKQLNEENKMTPETWETLTQSLHFNQEQLDVAATNRDLAWKALNENKRDFYIKAYQKHKEHSESFVKVLACIRGEIFISTDIPKHIEQLNENNKKIEQMMTSMFDHIESQENK